MERGHFTLIRLAAHLELLDADYVHTLPPASPQREPSMPAQEVMRTAETFGNGCAQQETR